MPSVQPLGAHRAPPRERELGACGGSDTDAPVGQQSTSPVSRDKPVRARRRVPLSGFECSRPKRSRHLPRRGAAAHQVAPSMRATTTRENASTTVRSDLRTLASPPSRTDSLAGKPSRDIRRVTLVAHPRSGRRVGDRFRLSRSPAFGSAWATDRASAGSHDGDRIARHSLVRVRSVEPIAMCRKARPMPRPPRQPRRDWRGDASRYARVAAPRRTRPGVVVRRGDCLTEASDSSACRVREAAEPPSRSLGRELVVQEQRHLGVGDAGDRPERVAGAGGEGVAVRRR